MQNVADEVRSLVDRVTPSLRSLNPNEVSAKSQPEKWSKKEILGHLIDSAANNHQRFVRAGYQAAATFPAYAPNDWVRVQRYPESDWGALVDLWSAYNRHLSDVVERLPASAFSEPCNVGKEEPAPLEEVVTGYLSHLRHHVAQLLG